MSSPFERFRNRLELRQVEQRLARDLSLAEQEYRRAGRRLQELTDSTASELQSPENNMPVMLAAEDLTRADSAYQAALERWRLFVSKGIVPEDLKNLVPAKFSS